MAGLQETQMWAVYQMGMSNEMPSSVTKEDLTCIIEFLFKQLDWIDEGPSSQPSSRKTVKSPIFVDPQNSEDQAQKNSFQTDSHGLEGPLEFLVQLQLKISYPLSSPVA